MSDDDILDSYLSGDSDISALYQQSKQAPEGPAAETDQAVLAAAKRSVDSGPSATKRRLRPSWLVPASAAATVVLSASIYLTNQPLLDPSADFAPSGYDGSYDSAAESETLRQPSNTQQPPLRRQLEPQPKRTLLDTPQSIKAEIHAEQAKSRSEKKKAPLSTPPVIVPQTAGDSTGSEHENRNMAVDSVSADKSMPAEQLSAAEEVRIAEPEAKLKQQAPQSSALQAFSSAPQIPEREYRATAQRWLTEIERLLDLDELKDAQNELNAFQQKHPDQPLPERIEALLQSPERR